MSWNQHFSIAPGSLYRPEMERDACGVGFIASLQGERSHRILDYGLTSVCRVVHRGARDADGKTGDGAGVTTQIPSELFRHDLESNGVSPEGLEHFGVGVFYFSGNDSALQERSRQLVEEVLSRRQIPFYGWREVPVDPSALGEKARATMPLILHALVGCPLSPSGKPLDGDAFERALYLARRECEKSARREKIRDFYVPSFSHRTISYKALVVSTVLRQFYLDLQNSDYRTAICLYHQRFSTNTFPTWPLSQPFRMLAHNGEINTLRGNRNWMRARESDFSEEIWGEDVKLLKPLIDPKGSDSSSLDTALEILVLSGRSLMHAMSLLVPPAYRIDPSVTEKQLDFYQYQRCFAEPWDGPAALVFTDGRSVGACLDRNGLRPARYKLTEDGLFTLGSEVGVVEIDDATVIEKGRLAPGEMICLDTVEHRLTHDKEIKNELAEKQPYSLWIKENRFDFKQKEEKNPSQSLTAWDPLTLSQKQVAFDYNKEELDMVFAPMVGKGQEAVYSMGDDTPLAVLSTRPRLLYNYFKQHFAQVTNPPIDPIRERLVMSLAVSLGWYRDILVETPQNAEVVYLDTPFLFEKELETLCNLDERFPARTLDITWPVAEAEKGMAAAIDALCQSAEKAADEGIRLLVLSDRAMNNERVAIPSLLATGAVHHHLVRSRKRLHLSLVIDTGEARDTHQVACLFGYGANAICPYLGLATVREVLENDKKKQFEGISLDQGLFNYRQGLENGVLKIMSKMGISLLSSYQGAQIFEALGLSHDLVERCFAGTPTQISGVGFTELARETLARHAEAYGTPGEDAEPLKLTDPGYNRFRRDGELHAVDAPVLKNFHTFVKSGKEEDYEQYVQAILQNKPLAIHDLFELVPAASGPVPLEEVEPIESIRRRFTTAGMSYGALSPEAHEALAIAMNRIGGKSNSGEGGEDKVRFKPLPNGDSKNSAIKQVASGRFGVHAEYLASATEIEIKMAQGAKPGEGGQLPAHKVNGMIAKLRHTSPGVALISPPPHHDIYSIEDLAQLIHDLKEVNPRAKICVKLVAETGVGTIAAGVAKANADIILVSGHDGGTGASPLSSIKHAGMPWEIGVAETQQVLMLNGLRDRVILRTDGGMRTGLDIIKAAILGAEEYNFGTIALIAMGCVYVRKCHLNTCPVGVATTDEKYRAKFKGSPEMVINFFNSVAHEVREHMAALGVRQLDELIGAPRYLTQREVPGHPKANTLDLSRVLYDVNLDRDEPLPRTCQVERNDGIQEPPLDDTILADAAEALDKKEVVTLSYAVKNTHRNVGTKLAGEIAHRYGNKGYPDNAIRLELSGSAGQSFGAFLVQGIHLELTGEANDYVGKGMNGGEIIIRPPEQRHFQAATNSIIGNTVLYGATGGALFASGKAGERFGVRNSGGVAVVEAVGDHGCEYMTNGTIVVLGETGKNFGAGMSGGVAFVYDESGDFPTMMNRSMVEPNALEDPEDVQSLQHLISRHAELTGSKRAREILDLWEQSQKKFVVVRPTATAAPATDAKASEPKAVVK